LGFSASSIWSAPDFARDVRPILERSCFGCHGPEKRKNGYRLDLRENALRGGDSGKAAILPHNAKASPLIRYVSGEDEEIFMPPKKSDKPALSSAEIQMLREWIDAGPTWPDALAGTNDTRPHWSLTPLVKPALPSAEAQPIDAFIHAKLAEKKLTPSPEADRRTLIRRVTFDLTGLPPTPEEVASFIADKDKRAYEKLVGRLLDSPRYGEHWARHWLDVVNYADTHGNDHDYARPNAWPYRDYVIDAFNRDTPYGRFVQQQLAGDVLFPDDPQAPVALGFLAAGPWDETLMVGVREDTVDHRMAQNLDRDNMVTTVMSTFQSLTVHCARCHNHKFDPISQREYYGLQAVFAGVDRADRPYDEDARTHSLRRELLAKKNAISARAPAVLASLDSPETLHKVAAAIEAHEHRRQAWSPLEVVNVVSASVPDGTVFSRQSDGSWLASGTRPDKDTFIVTAQTNLRGIRAFRLEVIPDESLPHQGPGRYDNGNFHLSEFRVLAQPARGETKGAEKLHFTRAMSDHSDQGDLIDNAVDGRDDTYWSVNPRYGETHEAVFELKEPAGFETGTTFTILLDFKGKTGHQIGRWRLSTCTDALPPEQRAPVAATIAPLLRLPDADRTPKQRRELALQFLANEVESELTALPAPRLVYAVTRDFPSKGSFKPAVSPRPIYLLNRGDVNHAGDKIEPGALGCMAGLRSELKIAEGSDESARRAALAEWLTDSRNALTWRSIVNRVWSYHFDRGLCDTPNDFGKMGGLPSHPELLDWLAIWFRDEAKGSFKALHKLILTSATYRRSSTPNGKAVENDPENRLLSRMNSPRLSAEQLRDSVLQFSGSLDLKMGGPPAVQFVDHGKATFMPEGGAPAFLDYDHFDPDAPENRRRAIYRFLFRTVPDPFMDALDSPDGAAITPVRSVSVTPIQAFALLNDAFLIRQCEHIATRLAAQSKTPELQAEAAFRMIFLRTPHEQERAEIAAYIQRHGFANACQMLLNSNEFLYLN